MAVTADALEQEDGSYAALQELQGELVKVRNKYTIKSIIIKLTESTF
jgi:hypothetical protein